MPIYRSLVIPLATALTLSFALPLLPAHAQDEADAESDTSDDRSATSEASASGAEAESWHAARASRVCSRLCDGSEQSDACNDACVAPTNACMSACEESDEECQTGCVTEATTAARPFTGAQTQEPETREEEIAGICDTACSGSSSYDACFDSCSSETGACMSECDELPAGSDDCFIACTNLALEDARPASGASATTTSAAGAATPEEEEQRLGIGINLRGYIHNVPQFGLNPFFARSVSHWDDGAKFIFGGELLFRLKGTQDIVIGVDYADYSTRDGWWLDDDDPVQAADWVNNNLRSLNLTLEWNGISTLTDDGRLQLYGGAGLGVGVRMGRFRKFDINEGCVTNDGALSQLDALTPDTLCGGGDAVRDGSPDGETAVFEDENIPRVIPSIVFSLGLRYMIADVVSIGIEAGFKNIAFYGGLEVGFMLGRTTNPRGE